MTVPYDRWDALNRQLVDPKLEVVSFPTVSVDVMYCVLPASGMNTTKVEYLVSQLEHDSFEHGMAELLSTPNSTAAKTVVYGFEPRHRQTHISPEHIT